MTRRTSSFEEALAWTSERVNPNRWGVVAVDGGTGSGKSKFARFLAFKLNASLVELDLFMKEDAPPPPFRLDDLRRVFVVAPRVQRPLIVEGVFSFLTLAQLEVEPDAKVYVRRIGYGDKWRDERLFAKDEDDPDAPRRRLDASVSGRFQSTAVADLESDAPLSYRLAVYHQEQAPQEAADLVVDIQEDAPRLDKA